MPIITKDLAEAIAKKLGATMEKRKAHDMAFVFEDGKLVAHFGIRRGSRKDQSHDHLPNSLYMSPRDTRLFGECHIQRDEWVERMRAKQRL